MNPSRLPELLSDWGYATYLFLLTATGVGSPIPEDIILMTAGYLISAGVFSWTGAAIAGIVGVVGSNAMLYAMRQMPFGRLLLLDTAGALSWVPAVLALGAQLGEEIGGLDRIGAWVNRMAEWIVVGIVLLTVLWRWWRVGESKL